MEKIQFKEDMNKMKTLTETITKQIFSPVRRKIPNLKLVPPYKDGCWSIDLIDKSVSIYNKIYIVTFTIVHFLQSMGRKSQVSFRY